MFFILSKILDQAFAPLAWGMALVAASLVIRGRPGLARGLAASGLVVLVIFSLEPVANLLMRSVEAEARITIRDDGPYDAVIVLGGMIEPSPPGALEEGRHLNESGNRIVRAFELLREGRAARVLLSAGPGGPDVRSEAEMLRDMLLRWGIAPDRIEVETRSANTRENAVESARIVAARGWKRLLLVTSAFHMPRAMASFHAVGLRPDALPVDYRGSHELTYQPRVQYLDRSSLAIRELAGRSIYRIMGYSRD